MKKEQKVEAMPVIIENELATHNVIKQELEKVAQRALGLKLANPEDKQGYEEIEKLRKEIKASRVVIQKVCKAGRDSLNLKVKENLNIEKAILSIIEGPERHLIAQAAIYENEAERQKQEKLKEMELAEAARLAKIQERKDNRDADMKQLGAFIKKENGIDIYVLGDKSCYKDIFLNNEDEEAIHQTLEEFKVEKDRLDHEAHEKVQADQIERDRLAKQKEEQEQKERELEAKAKELKAQRFQIRSKMLRDVEWNGRDYTFNGENVASERLIDELSDDDWAELCQTHNKRVDTYLEEKRQQEIKELIDGRALWLTSNGCKWNPKTSTHEIGELVVEDHVLKDADESNWNIVKDEVIKMANKIKLQEKEESDRLAEQKRQALLPDAQKINEFIVAMRSRMDAIDGELKLNTDEGKKAFDMFKRDVSMSMSNLAIRVKDLIK